MHAMHFKYKDVASYHLTHLDHSVHHGSVNPRQLRDAPAGHHAAGQVLHPVAMINVRHKPSPLLPLLPKRRSHGVCKACVCAVRGDASTQGGLVGNAVVIGGQDPLTHVTDTVEVKPRVVVEQGCLDGEHFVADTVEDVGGKGVHSFIEGRRRGKGGAAVPGVESAVGDARMPHGVDVHESDGELVGARLEVRQGFGEGGSAVATDTGLDTTAAAVAVAGGGGGAGAAWRSAGGCGGGGGRRDLSR
jgi:hypothetical protein